MRRHTQKFTLQNRSEPQPIIQSFTLPSLYHSRYPAASFCIATFSAPHKWGVLNIFELMPGVIILGPVVFSGTISRREQNVHGAEIFSLFPRLLLQSELRNRKQG